VKSRITYLAALHAQDASIAAWEAFLLDLPMSWMEERP